MILVKDFVEGRIVYYWVVDAHSMERLSPYHHCIIESEEWWKNYMYSLYPGEERRHSIHDRRQDHDKRRQLELREKYNRTSPVGRRATDHGVQVEIDLYEMKIEQLRCGYE